MAEYTVHARGWRLGWELHIEGVGVTQCHVLDDAQSMVSDYVELAGRPAGGIRLIVEPGEWEARGDLSQVGTDSSAPR